jgi:hypothetical protein
MRSICLLLMPFLLAQNIKPLVKGNLGALEHGAPR